MTADKCRALLTQRLLHSKVAKKHPDGTLMTQHKGLYLVAGDVVLGSGWTQRELEMAQLPVGAATEVRRQALQDYCFADWARQDAQREAELQAEQRTREKHEALARWAKCGVQPRYSKRELDDLDVETLAQQSAIDKVSWFPYREGNGAQYEILALLGPPGTRKTQLAASWLRREMLDDGMDGQFVTAADLVEDAPDAERMEHYATVDRLVIDDVGVDMRDVDVVARVVDARLNNELVTVFTSNLTQPQIKDLYGDRGYSRLMCNSLTIMLTGRDWRMGQPAENNREGKP